MFPVSCCALAGFLARYFFCHLVHKILVVGFHGCPQGSVISVSPVKVVSYCFKEYNT